MYGNVSITQQAVKILQESDFLYLIPEKKK